MRLNLPAEFRLWDHYWGCPRSSTYSENKSYLKQALENPISKCSTQEMRLLDLEGKGYLASLRAFFWFCSCISSAQRDNALCPKWEPGTVVNEVINISNGGRTGVNTLTSSFRSRVWQCLPFRISKGVLLSLSLLLCIFPFYFSVDKTSSYSFTSIPPLCIFFIYSCLFFCFPIFKNLLSLP